MSKKNARKHILEEEHHTGLSEPNPVMFTPPDPLHYFYAPVLTLPGKPPHRICRGRP